MKKPTFLRLPLKDENNKSADYEQIGIESEAISPRYYNNIPQNDLNNFIGMPYQDFIDEMKNNPLFENTTSRLTRRDKTNFIITHDFRLDRINIEIDNDKISRLSLG